jgi:hypothetical protein
MATPKIVEILAFLSTKSGAQAVRRETLFSTVRIDPETLSDSRPRREGPT